MLAYGASKAAAHHIVKSLAQPGSGMPTNSKVVAILPIMLDTPMNRKDMPNGNFDSWTPLDTVAQIFLDWATDKVARPENGAFVVVKTENKKTDFITV
jgi:dihydropteridine reductase